MFDAYLLGKMPEGMQPLDSERGTTAIGATAFDNEDAGARQAGDLAAAQLGDHPVLIGVPAPAPAPAPQPDARRAAALPRHATPDPRGACTMSVFPALGRRHVAPLLQHPGLVPCLALGALMLIGLATLKSAGGDSLVMAQGARFAVGMAALWASRGSRSCASARPRR